MWTLFMEDWKKAKESYDPNELQDVINKVIDLDASNNTSLIHQELTAIFFKNNGKWYETETIKIPVGIVTLKEDGDRFYSARNYIREHRSDFGYEEMTMVVPCQFEEEKNIIGYPMMIMPEEIV